MKKSSCDFTAGVRKNCLNCICVYNNLENALSSITKSCPVSSPLPNPDNNLEYRYWDKCCHSFRNEIQAVVLSMKAVTKFPLFTDVPLGFHPRAAPCLLQPVCLLAEKTCQEWNTCTNKYTAIYIHKKDEFSHPTCHSEYLRREIKS